MIEDVYHWMLSCPVWQNQCQPIIARSSELKKNEFDDLSTDVEVAVIVDLACRNHKIAKFLCVTCVESVSGTYMVLFYLCA